MKMRKKVVMGFAFGTLLCIVVLSCNNDVVQRMTPFFVNIRDDIDCYIEQSTRESLETMATGIVCFLDFFYYY